MLRRMLVIGLLSSIGFGMIGCSSVSELNEQSEQLKQEYNVEEDDEQEESKKEEVVQQEVVQQETNEENVELSEYANEYLECEEHPNPEVFTTGTYDWSNQAPQDYYVGGYAAQSSYAHQFITNFMYYTFGTDCVADVNTESSAYYDNDFNMQRETVVVAQFYAPCGCRIGSIVYDIDSMNSEYELLPQYTEGLENGINSNFESLE